MPTLSLNLPPGPVITDGAWGTQLQAQGLGAGECPDAWNLTHAGRVEAVARAYVEAGSQVILTNTFGASRLRLAAHGLGDRTLEINRAGARISRRAAGDRVKVFASIGPTGRLLAMGETTKRNCAPFLRSRRARWLPRVSTPCCSRPLPILMRSARPSPRPRRPACRWWPAWCLTPARPGIAR